MSTEPGDHQEGSPTTSRRTADASPTDTVESAAERALVDCQLSDLLETMEEVDWATVPGVSVPEAAAWTARMDEAREQVQEGGR